MAEDTRVVVGAAAVARRIRTIRAGVHRVLVDDESIAEYLVDRNKRRFKRQVGPDETPWKRLKRTTVKRKARGDSAFPDRILYDTGRLYRSIGVLGRRSGKFGIDATNTYRIGVRDPKASFYGELHQLGEGGMPERPFLGINVLDVKGVDSLLRRAIIRLVERS